MFKNTANIVSFQDPITDFAFSSAKLSRWLDYTGQVGRNAYYVTRASSVQQWHIWMIKDFHDISEIAKSLLSRLGTYLTGCRFRSNPSQIQLGFQRSVPKSKLCCFSLRNSFGATIFPFGGSVKGIKRFEMKQSQLAASLHR